MELKPPRKRKRAEVYYFKTFLLVSNFNRWEFFIGKLCIFLCHLFVSPSTILIFLLCVLLPFMFPFPSFVSPPFFSTIFLSIFLFHSPPPCFLLLDDRLLCTNEPFPNLFLHLFFSLCSLASVLLVLGDTYNIPLDPRGKTKTTWWGADGSTSQIFYIKCIILSEISDVPTSVFLSYL